MAIMTTYYMKNHDIDIFFRIGRIPIHIATNGCIIPKYLADYKQQKKILNRIRKLSQNQNNRVRIGNEIFIQTILNESYFETDSENLEQLIDSNIEINDIKLNLFCQSFYHFSEKGLYSFDYSPKTKSFYLVTKPTLILNDIEILKLMPNNTFIDNFDFENINLSTGIKFFEDLE